MNKLKEEKLAAESWNLNAWTCLEKLENKIFPFAIELRLLGRRTTY